MDFRIVGPHTHRATVGGRVFSCTRQSTATDTGLTIAWTAWENQAVLKSDCRTLNEAKNLCRSKAAAAVVG